MFCRRCGAENNESARFCLRCGAKLAAPEMNWWDDRRVRLALVIFAALLLTSVVVIVIMALRPVPLPTPAPGASSTVPAPATTVVSRERETDSTPPATPDELGTGNLYLEYIIDASGSMNDALPDGSIKLQIARDLLGKHLQAFRPGTNIGLRAYGHRVPYQQTEESCQDIELIAPVQQGQLETIVTWLQNFKAQGMTPLAESIRLAMEDFVFEPGRINSIVMISDGEETCDGDPCGLVEELKAQGINFTIHVIGLDVDEATREQLLCIAGAAGGTYHDARSAEDLEASLGNIQRLVIPDGTTLSHATDTPTPILATMPSTPLRLTVTLPTSATPVHTSSPTTMPASSYSGRTFFLSSRDYETPEGVDPRQTPHELYVMDPDGSNQERLTTGLPASPSPGLAVSPDGRKVMFPCQMDPQDHTTRGLCYIDLNAPDSPIQLTRGSDYSPAWSPDGQRIAFERWLDTNQEELFLMNADGTDLRRLTDNSVRDLYIDWSPDGSTLAYMHDYELWLMKPDGTGKRRLMPGYSGDLAWSSDGWLIAFERGNTADDSDLYSNMDIWVVSSDGSHPRNLTNSPGIVDDSPAWSPDGTAILFQSVASESGWLGVWQILMIDIASGEVTQLTSEGNNQYPAWAP